MLTLTDLSKAYGGQTLFQAASLQVNRGDRLGLVGPNGAGKSTLFSIILGDTHPDSGSVTCQKNIRIGHLPQESAPVGSETVLEIAIAVTREMPGLWRRMSSGENADVDTVRNFETHGGYELVTRARKILSGLGFSNDAMERRAETMSGGWVMRAHLARLLVMEPDLLMLDEPTNHLDLVSLLWLQEYLQSYPGAILMISHDRSFLNALVGGIVELHQGRLNRYRGNYDEYLTQRAANEANQLAAYKNQQKEIKRLTYFVDRFRAKATKASQAQSKLKQIDRMEKIEAPVEQNQRIHFSFPQPPRGGLKSVTLKNVHHAYGDQVVYRGIDFQAERGQRIVLVGPNGAGKSTLLKLLAGLLPVQQGERILGHNVQAGYYSQYRVEMLHDDRTVLEEAMDTPQRVSEQMVRTLLGSFLFSGDSVFKKVAVLSGGEKSRLALVKILLDPPNLLLMDEPTTHLDMSSIEALLGALKAYSGTLIFISHDVYFIRQVANHVVHVQDGVLTHYPGDYHYFLDKSGGLAGRQGIEGGRFASDECDTVSRENSRSAPSIKERKRLEAEERQERSRRRKAQQKVVDDLEQRIHDLESRQADLLGCLESPGYQSGRAIEINRELEQIVQQLQSLTSQWEVEAGKLVQLQAGPPESR